MEAPTPEAAPVLLAYQRGWIGDDAQVKVIEKSRQIGLTWSEAADAVLIAGRKPGKDYYYISYNEDMTAQFIRDCKFWLGVFQIAAEETEEVFVEGSADKLKALQIPFASGNVIQALSGRPRNLRSKRGVVCIDEAAFCDDLEELIKAAIAFTMWGGKVRIVSTHNGDESPFNELVTDVRAGKRPYSLHRVTLDDALADGLFRKICEKTGQEWDPERETAWRTELADFYGDGADEELFCVPRQSGGRYIPRAVIEAAMRGGVPVVRWACRDDFTLMDQRFREAETQSFCLENLDPVLAGLPKLPSFMGEDFGRSGDLTVIWLLQRRQDLSLETPLVVELRNVPFEQQKQVIFYLLDRLPRFYGGAMDRRGNGEYLAEVTKQRFGSRIEGVALCQGWYLENMPRMKAALEDGKLTIPKDSDHLDDLRAVTLVRGVPLVPDVRTAAQDKGGKRHGDAAVALCMAVAAARSADAGPVWVEPGPRREMSVMTDFY